jgi:hypothetical protein
MEVPLFRRTTYREFDDECQILNPRYWVAVALKENICLMNFSPDQNDCFHLYQKLISNLP